MQHAVFGYVRGQILFSTIMGTSAGVCLWILGSLGIFPDGKTYAVVFGAWYGFAELIPYVGPAIGAAPPVLLALVSGDPLDALWLTIMFTALQQIEGHIVAPTVFSQALRINPLLVIFALLIGGRLYGFAGAFIALPIAAVLRETVVYLRRHLVLEPWSTRAGRRARRGRDRHGRGARPRPARSAAPPGRRARRTARAAARSSTRRTRPPTRRRPRDGGPAAALRAEAVGKRYGERDALRDVSFSAAPGELVAVIGPNGAGKTTLLQILAGALRGHAGQVETGARRPGWVPQQAALYGKLSVAENLRLFARLERVPDVEARRGRDARPDRPARPGRRPGRRRSRAATGSGSTSPSGCWPGRTCSCSTSRAPRSTRASGRGCGSSSAGSPAPAPPWSTPRTTSRRPSATRIGCWCSPMASCCSGARRRSWRRPRAAAPAPTSRRPSSPSCARRGISVAGGRSLPAMRWLLLKDLRILRRSPLLLALLVAYPVLVALLVGVGLSSGPAKPRVAFVNLVPPAEDTIEVGGRRLDASGYAARLFEAVEPVRVRTRAEAIAKVRSGDVLGALVIPADAIERLRSTLTLGASAAPTVEVYYAAENPLKRRYVQSTIRATLADANRALSAEVLREAVRYLDLVVAGGTLDVPIVGPVDILGLRRAQTIIEAVTAGLPEGTPERVALDQVERFARLAADNLDLSQPILGSIGTPVRVRERSLSGSGTALDVFGAEVAVTLSLMIVALLLAAGMLALEREEHAFGRLVRGLVSRTGLLVEKAGARRAVRLGAGHA